MINRTAWGSQRNAAHAAQQKHSISHILRAVFIGACVAGAMSACSSSGRDHNGDGNAPGVVDTDDAGGLIFSYPVDGQTDVYPQSQIAFAFDGDVSGDNVALYDKAGHKIATDVVNQGNGIFNIRVTDSDAALAPGTKYFVKATKAIGVGNTQFKKGATLFSFTTEQAAGSPSAKGFSIVSHRGDKNDKYPFLQFTPIRATFSESVAEGSVKLCTGNEDLGDDNCTVAVTGPKGNVPGRLTVLGRNFVFDPGTGHVPITSNDAGDYDGQDLTAGARYTVSFSDDFKSAFGHSLKGDGFSVTPVSIGKDVIQNLIIGNAATSSDDNDDNDSMSPLNGRTRDNIELASQLIGSYNLAASADPSRGGLKVRIAEPTDSGSYNGTFPTEIPRGQEFQLSAFKLKLGGTLNKDGTFSNATVDTPVNLDHLNIQFANDVDAFLAANSLRNIEKPTRVQLRLDLNITGDVPDGSPIAALSNGVVNQTALNVIASGIAIPQPNGDVSLVTLGSFPIAVNRDGQAAVNFELALTLPASADDQPTIIADQTAPTITAEYPSACSYVFNTTASAGDDDSTRFLFQSGDVVGGVSGTTSLSDIESNCVDLMSQRVILNANETADFNLDEEPDADATFNFPNPWANNLPLSAAPSVLFSEPVDPASLNGNITLANADGDTVASRLAVEGANVVVYPVRRLKADAKYTLLVGSGITDLAGNSVTNTSFPGGSTLNMVTFTTEPMVVPTDDDGNPTDIDRDQNEAVRQIAPFLTALTPGLPCALQTVDQFNSTNLDTDADISSSDYYRNGGNVAGRCVGDSPSAQFVLGDNVTAGNIVIGDATTVSQASKQVSYRVFGLPNNAPVTGYFSKPVRANTIRLANGCLVGGDGNTTDGATVAIQIMNGDSCSGTVPGAIATLSPGSALTTGFSFRPDQPFEAGQRYWVVICGSSNPDGDADDDNQNSNSQCSSGATIVGQNGLALNTTPLLATGTREIIAPPGDGVATFNDQSSLIACNGVPVSSPNSNVACFEKTRGEGGPDILMPFDGQVATAAYRSTQQSLPLADTNGNGMFDNTPAGFTPNLQRPDRDQGYFLGGVNSDQFRGITTQVFNESLGRERAQFSNVAFISTVPGSPPAIETAFLGGARPIQVEASESGAACSPAGAVSFDDGSSVVGSSSSTCVPVSLLPGGLTTVTGLLAQGLVPTGQILLRFPDVTDADGTTRPQQGYIIPKCQGTSPDGESYDYEPCFVANLTLTGSAPDFVQGAIFAQQDINVRVYGPVAFEQDGRLAIAVKNANTFYFAILANLPFVSLATGATTIPGDQALQLIGSPVHGGQAFPTR